MTFSQQSRRSLGLTLANGCLRILDQRRLPDDEIWLDGSDPDVMVTHIRELSVRGAPLIGVAAALSLACYAGQSPPPKDLRAAAARLRAARPTAVNLMTAIDRALGAYDHGGADALRSDALAIFDEDVAMCERMAEHGAALIRDGDGIITHCNAGGLATVGIGTAIGVIRRAREQGKCIHVYADETRPLLQGARLTVWELARLGIPYTLVIDSAAAVLLATGRVQGAFVGADRIARNGDFANKIGTLGLAQLCRIRKVPLYVVAPCTTVDLTVPSGKGIPVEERSATEVRGASGAFGSVRWSPADAPVFNPAFDVTPGAEVAGFVLDTGVILRRDLKDLGFLRRYNELLSRRAEP